MAKHLTVARVIPYRFRLKANDIAPPLSQFQSVGDDETGTWRLLQTINGVSEPPLKDEQLKKAFRTYWPKLNTRLTNIAKRRKEIERLRDCEKELANYPRGPAIGDSFIPHSFIQEVADEFNERNLILDLVSAANRLRQAANPGDLNVTVIRHGLLVTNDTAYAAWGSVFHEARLNSPRMLAAILMVLPIGTDPLKQERDLLLAKLKTISSRTRES